MQTACIGLTASRQVERGAVVNRSPDEGQSQRDVDGPSESRVLEHGQPLVMIHGDNGVTTGNAWWIESRIGRYRTVQPHAVRAKPFNDRDNNVVFFVTQVTPFAGVRVQPQDLQARLLDSKLVAQSALGNAYDGFQLFRPDRFRHFS